MMQPLTFIKDFHWHIIVYWTVGYFWMSFLLWNMAKISHPFLGDQVLVKWFLAWHPKNRYVLYHTVHGFWLCHLWNHWNTCLSYRWINLTVSEWSLFVLILHKLSFLFNHKVHCFSLIIAKVEKWKSHQKYFKCYMSGH